MKNINKFLDWGVKISSIAITGPATWSIAVKLFSHWAEPWFTIGKFGGLFAIEGVMLGSWILLEYKKDALPQVKVRYALTALGMFLIMCVVAWADEGPLGLVFRAALLAALIGSGWDTYVETWNSIAKKTDKSIENSPKVRKVIRKLSEEYAIAEAQADSVIKNKLLTARLDSHTIKVELAVQRNNLLSKRASELTVEAEIKELEAVNAVNFTDNLQEFTEPLRLEPVSSVLITKKPAPDDTDHKIVEVYKNHPGISYRKASEILGISHMAIANRVKDLEIFGLLKRENGSVYPVEVPALPASVVLEESPQPPPANYVPVPPTADPQPEEPESRFQNATNTGEF